MNSTATHVLEALTAEAGWVSSTGMVKRTRVSRMAISKQVGRLREMGYGIEACPRLGYRLTGRTDQPVAAEVTPRLSTRVLGRPYLYLAETSSTNTYLRDRMGELAEGAAVAADSQTAGRGRLQRAWHSPPGVNLHLSVLLKPAVPPMMAPQLSLVAAAALLQALHARGLYRASVKWPNDILCGGKKLAGVLCEMEAETDLIHAVIIGIGMNVNLQVFPRELRKTATSAHIELKDPVPRPAMAAEILNRLDALYALWNRSGLKDIVPFLNQHSYLAGRRVRVALTRSTVRGIAEDITPDGLLRVKQDDGSLTEISSGEVCLCRGESA